MNLINILYEPYVIMIFVSLIITGISYFIITKNNKNSEESENTQDNNSQTSKTLLLTFIISYLLLIFLHFVIGYMNKNNFFQKGGNVVDLKEHLTIVADDVDVGFID